MPYAEHKAIESQQERRTRAHLFTGSGSLHQGQHDLPTIQPLNLHPFLLDELPDAGGNLHGGARLQLGGQTHQRCKGAHHLQRDVLPVQEAASGT